MSAGRSTCNLIVCVLIRYQVDRDVQNAFENQFEM
jgi:hypothetical protein